MNLSSKLKNKGSLKHRRQRAVPLWKGPEEDGVTQSLLAGYLGCKERFRVRVIDGLGPADRFNHRLAYGDLFHLCEESSKSGGWRKALTTRCRELARKYPMQQTEVAKWYKACLAQYPIYLDYWHKHQKKEGRERLLAEEVFSVPYTLPSGRVVLLRGKWDGVDLYGKGKQQGVYLWETKTKSDIREEQIRKQLKFDLQTMMYLIALWEFCPCDPHSHLQRKSSKEGRFVHSDGKEYPIKGVIYNVVRRPLSGGKGSIRQHKATKNKPEETEEHYWARVGNAIKENEDTYFMRWTCTVTKEDILKFRRECLDPLLENLCEDYEWWVHCKITKDCVYGIEERALQFPNHGPCHCRTPFNLWTPLLDGGSTELDDYLMTGSMVGIHEIKSLFPELQV